MLPLVRNGIATSAIMSFIFSWNQFLFSPILSGPRTKTVPVAVYNFISYGKIDWAGIGAAAASYLNGKRWKNLSDIEKYTHKISAKENPAEEMEITNHFEPFKDLRSFSKNIFICPSIIAYLAIKKAPKFLLELNSYL